MGVPGSANFLLAGAQGYQIERSLRFNSADSAYLNRTPASAGNRKTWTWSGWVKRTAPGAYNAIFSVGPGSNDSDELNFRFTNTDTLEITGGITTWRVTTQVFRDSSAWYHIIFACDTTQATANDRFKLYVNGTQITAFSTTANPSQNADLAINSTAAHYVGQRGNSTLYLNGYLTEVHFIDGQALTPSSFGETDTITGVWKPKKYAGTYGTNGFYLKFADNSGTTSTTLGKDSSGNGNNWTPNNFSVTAGSGNDSMIDTPTPYADGGNGRGNYCTWNPLSTIAFSLANGNLDVTGSTTSNRIAKSTFAVSSGKWYWEITNTSLTASSATLGICSDSATYSAGVLATGSDVLYYGNNGNKYVNGSASAYGASFTTNDVIGIALDLSANTVTFYKNNTSQGSISITSGITWVACWVGQGNTADAATANFGQRPFAYTPPSGFLALNTQNLPEPTIKKPSSYFDAKLYTGNGSTQTISGFGFSPNLVWLKGRSTAYNHFLADSVRGISNELVSNDTAAEATYSNKLTALNSDGFSLGSTSTGATINNNGTTYVAWCWDESATPGFDIVTYTGNGGTQNISHNLGVSPSFIIVKNRSTVTNWIVWHSSFAATDYIALNLSSAKNYAGSLSTLFTGVSSTTISIGSNSSVNENGISHVAYLWSEVAGFSKFGSYVSNNSTDGPFVYCGFRPAWVLCKDVDRSGMIWIQHDSARSPYNAATNSLSPASSSAEPYDTASPIDILSNGFKFRGGSSSYNNYLTDTYIFAAFAESPFKYSLAR